jgi:hypothetical protein
MKTPLTLSTTEQHADFAISGSLLFATAWFPTFVSSSNPAIQYYSVILSLALLVFFIAATFLDDQEPAEFWHSMLKVIGAAVVVLVILGLFLLPASGKFAEFLLWHAVTATLLIITVIVAGLIVGFTGWNFFWPYAMLVLLDLVIITMVWIRPRG